VRGGVLNEEVGEQVDRWCEERGIRCLYLLADANDADTARAAARLGYRQVDDRLTFRHELKELGAEPWHSPGPISVRTAKSEDLPALESLATSSHRHTRFYFDGGFPLERCGLLYVRWIERAQREAGHELLIAEQDGKTIGYHAIRMPGPEPGRLDLIALEPSARGRGLGRALLRSSLRRLRDQGAEAVLTSMQARNVTALRSHERVGFVAERAQVWHHKWYGEPNGS
jgi:GNAT superfamily N-acetyltransferase